MMNNGVIHLFPLLYLIWFPPGRWNLMRVWFWINLPFAFWAKGLWCTVLVVHTDTYGFIQLMFWCAVILTCFILPTDKKWQPIKSGGRNRSECRRFLTSKITQRLLSQFSYICFRNQPIIAFLCSPFCIFFNVQMGDRVCYSPPNPCKTVIYLACRHELWWWPIE